MIKLGYALSSEEHEPNKLVAQAQMAESAGFKFVIISDHFHPWVSQQGQSSFVWSILGSIAQATQRVSVGTGVTCPIMRIHPALVAQAAATVADAMPGRFFLGLGTGEYLMGGLIVGVIGGFIGYLVGTGKIIFPGLEPGSVDFNSAFLIVSVMAGVVGGGLTGIILGVASKLLRSREKLR